MAAKVHISGVTAENNPHDQPWSLMIGSKIDSLVGDAYAAGMTTTELERVIEMALATYWDAV